MKIGDLLKSLSDEQRRSFESMPEQEKRKVTVFASDFAEVMENLKVVSYMEAVTGVEIGWPTAADGNFSITVRVDLARSQGIPAAGLFGAALAERHPGAVAMLGDHSEELKVAGYVERGKARKQ